MQHGGAEFAMPHGIVYWLSAAHVPAAKRAGIHPNCSTTQLRRVGQPSAYQVCCVAACCCRLVLAQTLGLPFCLVCSDFIADSHGVQGMQHRILATHVRIERRSLAQ